MAMEESRFRIFKHKDGTWAFEDVRRGQIVPGFKSAKQARQAFERERHD